MAQKTVFSDASPLIGLAAAGGFELLRRLFGTITVTRAVRDEVAAGKAMPGAKEIAAGIRAGWIKVIKDPPQDDEFTDLDAGEATILRAALRAAEGALVLIDEPLGRGEAKARGIAVTGMAGVLLAAKRSGHVRSVRPYFEALARTDFRLSEELIRTVLAVAGEA